MGRPRVQRCHAAASSAAGAVRLSAAAGLWRPPPPGVQLPAAAAALHAASPRRSQQGGDAGASFSPRSRCPSAAFPWASWARSSGFAPGTAKANRTPAPVTAVIAIVLGGLSMLATVGVGVAYVVDQKQKDAHIRSDRRRPKQARGATLDKDVACAAFGGTAQGPRGRTSSWTTSIATARSSRRMVGDAPRRRGEDRRRRARRRGLLSSRRIAGTRRPRWARRDLHRDPSPPPLASGTLTDAQLDAEENASSAAPTSSGRWSASSSSSRPRRPRTRYRPERG